MIRKLIKNRYISEKLPEALEKIAPVLLYPLFGILIIGLLMNFVIEPVMGAINGAMNSGLMSMSGSSKIILGMILGGMMATLLWVWHLLQRVQSHLRQQIRSMYFRHVSSVRQQQEHYLWHSSVH